MEILNGRIEEQAVVIEQLRDERRLWLGLNRSNHEKISQYFQGSLPNDDIILPMGSMELPDDKKKGGR